MGITLVRVKIQDAEKLWKMQIAAFQDLYEKYQDPETSPATETLEKTIMRLEQSFTYFYYITVDDTIVGAMRVIDHKEEGRYKFLSPIFIKKEFRGRGYAQQAIQLAERFMEVLDGNLIPSYKKKVTATYMRKWVITKRGKQKL